MGTVDQLGACKKILVRHILPNHLLPGARDRLWTYEFRGRTRIQGFEKCVSQGAQEVGLSCVVAACEKLLSVVTWEYHRKP